MAASSITRLLFTLSLALMLVVASDSFARGRGGGGRAAGGARAGGKVATPSSRNFSGPASGNIKAASPKTGGHNFGNANIGQINQNPRNFGQAGNPRSAQPRANSPQQVQQFLGGQQGNLNQPNSRADQLQGKAQNFDRSNVQSHADQASGNFQSAVNNWQSGPEPFSPAWYADHPNAWQATHPYAGAAAVATTAGVLAWTTAYPATYAASNPTTVINNTYVHDNSYIDEDPIDEEPIDDDEPIDEEPIDETEPAPAGEGQWMSLGTFNLAPGPNAPPSRVMQLSISKQGEVRGVYVDQLSGATHNLKGRFARQQQLLTWHVESNPGVQYETTLNDLTSGHGKVLVMKASGAYEWSLTRHK
ncbi:hypothetical protein [Aeoliella sp.]|uniref:hypothetical protein n=1 Tax=Aeoliella sp. TaxID=2795800 RepID=UPI003CCB7E47